MSRITAQVINPVLALPTASRTGDMPPSARRWLWSFLKDISQDARDRAERSWKTHKAPMALYWKCVAVYTGHLARVLRPTLKDARAWFVVVGRKHGDDEASVSFFHADDYIEAKSMFFEELLGVDERAELEGSFFDSMDKAETAGRFDLVVYIDSVLRSETEIAYA